MLVKPRPQQLVAVLAVEQLSRHCRQPPRRVLGVGDVLGVGSPSGAGGSPSVSGGRQSGAAWSRGGDGCVLSTAQTSAAARGEVVAIRGANCSVLINGTRFRN